MRATGPDPRRARAVLALALVVLATVGTGHAAARARPFDPDLRPPVRGQATGLTLVAQSPTVAPGGLFELRLGIGGLPLDGTVQLVLHDRVRSRSELATSFEGSGLRRQIYGVASLIAALPAEPDGSRRLALSFDPALPGGIRLSASGAYPLEVIAKDAAGTELDTLITHVLAEPPAADESPALDVAVVASMGAPPALQPDGSIALDDDDLADHLRLAEALAAVPAADATLAVVPETLDALATRATDDDLALIDALRAAAVGRSVLAHPYVDVSVQSLAAAGLRDQLTRQIERGRLVLSDALGVEPDPDTWLAGPDLAGAGLAALEAAGVEHLVVDPDRVEPLRSGPSSLSLARPFAVTPPGERVDPSSLDALALDAAIQTRLDADVPAPVLAHQLLAELAVLWFEQPGVARAVVVPVSPALPGDAVRILLDGLARSRLFEPGGLTEVISGAEPLLDAADSVVDRALEPADAETIPRDDARLLLGGWAQLDTFRGLVGADSPRTGPVVDHLLLATATDLTRRERRAHVDAATAVVDEVAGAVTTTDRTTITLTAREGTVPLTLRNDTGIPINVVIRLRSSKLEFPDGELLPVTLTEDTTRLDLAVRTRASGRFPLDVEVTSPDGRLVLTSTRYNVRSTAVAGAGVLLSVGAGLFLVVWWARHWRKTRRSRKLVAATHLQRDLAADPRE